MKIKRFEDILAWQKAQDLAIEVYRIFKDLKDFGFKDQLCRAVVSISNNIAEGFDRSSDADFARFLYMAQGSCSEAKSMIYLAERLSYIQTAQRETLLASITEIAKILNGLIRALKPPSAVSPS